jgi:hypothetical protein
MVPFHEGEGDRALGKPRKKNVEDLGCAADLGMQKVTSDDEVVCAGGFDKPINTSEIGESVSFRNGEASCPEGCRFAKMSIGENKGAGFREEKRVIGEQLDGSGWKIKGHESSLEEGRGKGLYFSENPESRIQNPEF